MPFARGTAEHDAAARASKSAVQEPAHLAAEHLGQLMLVSDRSLALLPEFANPPEGRRDHLGHSLLGRKEREGLVDGADDAGRVRTHRAGDELLDESLGVELGASE